MVLSGHQPNYWPYPGLIGKIMKSDCFIYVTKVQFEKKSWQKRNRIRTKDGWSYLQVPTLTKDKFDQLICDVGINNGDKWREKSLKTIRLLYSKAPFFDEYEPFLEELYSKQWNSLCDLNIYIMNYILNDLEIETKIYYDRDFGFTGKKTELLIEMCEALGCDTYLSNAGSAAYVQIDHFTEKGLNHRYIDYVGEEYPQQFYGFERDLSILDMLLNCGRKKTREILEDDSNYRYGKLNEPL